MERLVGELNPSAGLNFSDGYQATAVGKAVATGGTFLTYGKKLPQYVVFEGGDLKPVEWQRKEPQIESTGHVGKAFKELFSYKQWMLSRFPPFVFVVREVLYL